MIRILPLFIELAILVFCLIDCVQADSTRVRNLPKVLWALLIIVIPLVGGIAWLVAGRPRGEQAGGRVSGPAPRTGGFPKYEPPRAPRGPDDDPDFLRGLRDRERRPRENEPPPDEPPVEGKPRA